MLSAMLRKGTAGVWYFIIGVGLASLFGFN